MSTQTVVDEIKLKAPAWARDGSTAILQILDRCQKIMFSKPGNRTLWLDPLTGQPPFLATTAEIFTYALPTNLQISLANESGVMIPRTIRVARAVEVFIKLTQLPEYRQLMGDPARLASSVYSEFKQDRVVVRCTTIPATEATPAQVLFPFDPGTTTNKYQVKELIEPLRLTEDTIPLMVEEMWEPDLIEGALAWIENADYGKSEKWMKFQNESCIRFAAFGNEGNRQDRATATPPRPF